MAEEARAVGVPLLPFSPSALADTPNLVQHDTRTFVEETLTAANKFVGRSYKRPVCYSSTP